MDKKLYTATVAYLFISVVAVYSMSVFATIHFEASEFIFLKKQLISVIVAILVLSIVGRMNPYNVFKPLGFLLFFVSFFAIFIMLFLPDTLVKAVLGAKRWIKLGSFSIAPTEFFKYGFLFFFAWSLSRKVKDFQNGSLVKEFVILVPYFALLGIAAAIIAIGQKDLGQVVVLFAIFMSLLFILGISRKFFASFFILFVAAVFWLIKYAPHRIDRFKGWWVGVQDYILWIFPDSIANSLRVTDKAVPLHIINSLGAIKHGAIFGQGIGEGQYKLGFLSEVHTDFILAGISEEIGFLGLVLVVALFLYIVYRIFTIANKLDLLYEKLFAYGVAIVLLVEFIINAFGISGLIPIKGIAVPLLSYGGSQIIATSLAIAMVLMLSRKVNE
jgi:cell division protein FtsW